MIRSVAILLIILSAGLAAIPSTPEGHTIHSASISNSSALISDPRNGTLTAFNYTYSQANLYTNTSGLTVTYPSNRTGTKLVWQSTVTQTGSNTTIPGSGFEFNLTGGAMPGRQVVSWNITIPNFDCQGCTEVGVNFDMSGSLTKGSNATYSLGLYNPNSTIPFSSGTFTTPGSFPATGTTGCSEIFCVNLSSPKNYVGYHLNLSFAFAWNSSAGGGMYAQVGEITVASIGNFLSSTSNYMQVDPGVSTQIDHTVKLSPINYNNTLRVKLHPSPPLPNNATLTWNILGISIYYPSGYHITGISLNNTQVYPTFSGHPKEVPLETQTCVPGTNCSQALISLNMTDFGPTQPLNIHNSTLTVISTTANSISQPLPTVSGGVATRFFTSGDQIGVKVVNKPSIANASSTLQTGSLTVTFSAALAIASSTVSTLSGGVYNFTLPNCSTNQLCDKPLTVVATFTSGFDLGNATGTFTIDLLQVTLTGTGGSNSLSVQGTMLYGNGTAAAGVNATLFAIDRGTAVNTPYSYQSTGHAPGRLYISNITLVNGVFTQEQSLTVLFTIVNPNATQAYNATLTIEHDWVGPQRHGMAVTVTLGQGDQWGDLAFTNSTARTYAAIITFTGSGVQVKIKSLANGNLLPQQPLVMTQGTSPVLPNAPHSGLFNVTIASTINTKTSNQTLSSPNSILSPPYAYVSPSLSPGRYLYSSGVFKTGTNGGFSQTINTPSGLLGAQNLTVFILARNAFGVVVVNSQPGSIYTQSTALIASADSLGPVAKSQSATATLHLKSNSTLTGGITEVITVNLTLQGNGMSPQTVGMATGVTIAPGQSQTVQISFTAPSSIGSYTLSFSSPEYGGVLTSQTIQVTITSGYVQYLLPAAIGVVAAIIILGVYMVRGKSSEEETKEVSKPKGPSPKPNPDSEKTKPAKSLTQTGSASL